MNVLNCRSAPVAGSGVPVVFGMPSACLGCHQCECGGGGGIQDSILMKGATHDQLRSVHFMR